MCFKRYSSTLILLLPLLITLLPFFTTQAYAGYFDTSLTTNKGDIRLSLSELERVPLIDAYSHVLVYRRDYSREYLVWTQKLQKDRVNTYEKVLTGNAIGKNYEFVAKLCRDESGSRCYNDKVSKIYLSKDTDAYQCAKYGIDGISITPSEGRRGFCGQELSLLCAPEGSHASIYENMREICKDCQAHSNLVRTYEQNVGPNKYITMHCRQYRCLTNYAR